MFDDLPTWVWIIVIIVCVILALIVARAVHVGFTGGGDQGWLGKKLYDEENIKHKAITKKESELSKGAFTKILKSQPYILNDHFATIEEIQATLGDTPNLFDFGGVFELVPKGKKVKDGNNWLFSYIPFTNLTSNDKLEKMIEDTLKAGLKGVVFLNNKGGPMGKAETAAKIKFGKYYDDTFSDPPNDDVMAHPALKEIKGCVLVNSKNPEHAVDPEVAKQTHPNLTVISQEQFLKEFV
jgi:hypothetical protein